MGVIKSITGIEHNTPVKYLHTEQMLSSDNVTLKQSARPLMETSSRLCQ